MRAYSTDLRQRIVAAVDRGLPRAEVAQTFGVSRATINRYLKRRRDGGDLAPRASPGRPRTIPTGRHALLDAQLRAHPDATLAEHCARWREAHGVTLSVATMQRSLARAGWPRKKSR